MRRSVALASTFAIAFLARGRSLRTFELKGLPAGRGEVQWDGRGDDGEEIPSGVYLVRFETPRGGGVGKVVLAR